MHDRGERKPAGHHAFVVPSYDVLDGERMLKPTGLRAGDPPVALEVREPTHACRGNRVFGVSRCGSQLAARVVVVMVEVVHHRGRLAGHVLCAQHLETLPPPQEAAVFKHVPAVRMQSPEAALPRLVGPPGDFDEAVIEGEIVSEGVLPPLGVLSVVWKAIHDELVNVTQRQHLVRGVLDGHRCQ